MEAGLDTSKSHSLLTLRNHIAEHQLILCNDWLKKSLQTKIPIFSHNCWVASTNQLMSMKISLFFCILLMKRLSSFHQMRLNMIVHVIDLTYFV